MMRYADPEVCPACRHQIDRTAPACATCGVELLGPPAGAVFAALKKVDLLVAELPQHRDEPAAAPDVEPAAARPASVAPAAAIPSVLSAASVPKILLGLGALCLLVASIVFLVVAWAALGMDGRTGVLVGFTVAAAALMAWVTRRGLRAGAESFAVVVLGLVAIDLGGAREAGWLGPIDDDWFVVVAGSVVALVGAAIALWARRTQLKTLVGAEVGAALGVAAAAFGAAIVLAVDEPGADGMLVATLVCLVSAVVARRLRLESLTFMTRAETTLAWLGLVATGVDSLDPLTVRHLWLDLAGWPLLVAAALAGLVATRTHLPLWSRVTAGTAMALVGTGVLTAVAFDESATTITLVELAVVAVGGCVVALLRDRTWGWPAAVPSVVAASALAVSVVLMVTTTVETLLPAEVWGADLTGRLPGPDIPWTWPLLLPVGVIGIGGCLATVLACRGESARPLVVPATALTFGAAALVPPLYGVPLVVAVAVLVLAAALLGGTAWVTERVSVCLAAAGLLVVALVAGLADEWTTAGVLAVVLVAALLAERHPSPVMNALGLVVGPAATFGLTWTFGVLVGLPEPWRGLPVVVVLGLGVLHRPGAEREGLHALAAGVAIGASVVDPGGALLEGWLAIYLTVLGVVASGSALLHPSRRVLARIGLGFFAAAHWVALSDAGVRTVEAYTLPLAVVLLAFGCTSLLLRDISSVRALGPGLSLALVPSLVLVLEDPVGLRALLLGAACLGLVAVGVLGRVAAPLVAGALAGAVVVLRQGTLAELLPQWAIIGLVGIGLTVVGITWEQRLQELRRASAYVRGLR